MSDSSLLDDRSAAENASGDAIHSAIGDVVIAMAPCNVGDAPVSRSAADRFMRRALFIRDPDPTVPDAKVNKLFETSILISAIRCTLAYVVFPIFAPALYAASSWGPAIGLTIGSVALVFDVAGMRRFWKADHRWRWPMTGIYACVMVLVVILAVHDIAYLIA
ncbi:MAG: hypothetical protein JST73_04195 [Actinobacteria bacterium]|nr:hypothetical protein [Actinomycetota bacterium]